MAVTASSAFPGFFPPLELTNADVGGRTGEFDRQAFTDGGVFDNLGVRMFRVLERPLLAETPLARVDFLDFPKAIEALREAGRASTETPLRRLAKVLLTARHRPTQPQLQGPGVSSNLPPAPENGSPGAWEEWLLSALWDVLRHYQFYRDPIFAGLKLPHPEADNLLQASRPGGRVLDTGEQLWLNRHLLEAAFRQATGQACFRRLNSGLDGVIVSDVGKPFEVQGNRRAGGLIRTALRSTDILMDRVWQLETDTFQDAAGFFFAPITEVVDPSEDPTALHPEIQRQAATIRTDLDRFSHLEISTLVRHGYCVGRKACRASPDLFGDKLPENAPWDPTPASRGTTVPVLASTLLGGAGKEPAAATTEARTLQGSAVRRIWSGLLDHRDWTSYVYVPLLIPIFCVLPYLIVRSYEHSQQINRLNESLSQSSRDREKMIALLENRSVPWTGVAAEEVRTLDPPDYTGFEVLQDSRILDLRNWKPASSGKSDPSSRVFGYRRLKVLKLPAKDRPGNNLFRAHLVPTSPQTTVRFPAQQLQPRLRMSPIENSGPDKECRWEASFDFQRVPAMDFLDILVEYHSPGDYLQRGEQSTSLVWDVETDTGELTMWLLMPERNEYRSWRLFRHKTGKPETTESFKVITEYLAEDYTILAFKLLSLKAGYTYELFWYYK
jgi:hypothetical protein